MYTISQNCHNNLQAQITSNDTDISALQAVDVNLQLQITSNKSDIESSLASHAAGGTQRHTASNIDYNFTGNIDV